MNDPHCIFCFKAKSAAPAACFYGMHHEFPEPEVKQQPVKLKDAKLCAKCGLHPRNPASATNGCAHEYASA
jgi:hypothetical protein